MYKPAKGSIFRQTLASLMVTIKPQIERRRLLNLVRAGTTVFRINLSWFSKKNESRWIETLRNIKEIESKENLILGVMLDTVGPEFRVNEVPQPGPKPKAGGKSSPAGRDDSPPPLLEYQAEEVQLVLDSSARCTADTIYVTGPAETQFRSRGDWVVFDDAKYRARIIKLSTDGNSMTIRPDTRMFLRKGAKVNFPGTELTAPPISAREMNAVKFFVEDARAHIPEINFMFAQSFIKSEVDIDKFSGLLAGFNIFDPIIIAKLETYECVASETLTQITQKAAAVMIARGDLANETSRRQAPGLQRKIIEVAKEYGRPVLLATGIYGSMARPETFHPTRPEAEDVRSAVEWGVDGFVLTAETTSREDPETVVAALAKQIESDERELIEGGHFELFRNAQRERFQSEMRKEMARRDLGDEERREIGTMDFAIAAVYRANTYRAQGIFAFTATGATVRAMSRFYPETHIYALTPRGNTAQLLLLFRCTHPILIESPNVPKDFDVREFKALVRQVARSLPLNTKCSNFAIATMAHPPLEPGGTDTLLRIKLLPR